MRGHPAVALAFRGLGATAEPGDDDGSIEGFHGSVEILHFEPERLLQGRFVVPGCVREGGLQDNGIDDDAVDER